MARRLLLVVLWLSLLTSTSALAADVRAWLDRDSMQMGETVTLNIESSDGGDEPDFAPLAGDFELLGRSSSSSVSIANGQASSTQLWAIGLKPRREGRIDIPALAVGKSKTAPLALTVGSAPVGASAAVGDDIYIEFSADPLTPYVQQQVRVTAKLFYAVNLTDGALDEVAAADLVVQKLGQDRSYEAQRNERRYRVLERRYAVVPEKSGIVEIPALNFRGRALAGNDPGAMFFGRGRSVAVHSEAISLDVRPRPAESGSGPWMPAQSLTLRSDGVSGLTRGRVGEPVTITVTALAQGLGFEQIPELTLPPIDGAEVYPDKSVTRSREDGGWVMGERSRKFAIVPTRPGRLVIPAIRWDWWDTAANTAAQATTQAVEIEVAPAPAGVAAPPASTGSATDATATPLPQTPALSDADAQALRIWRGVALSSLGLWLVSVLLLAGMWWRARRARAAVLPTADTTAVRKAFRQALTGNDAGAVARTLLAWARREGFAARNLGELSLQLASSQQRDAIAALQALQFAADAAPRVIPAAIAAAFRDGFTRAIPRAANDDGVLPPLWPRAGGQ